MRYRLCTSNSAASCKTVGRCLVHQPRCARTRVRSYNTHDSTGTNKKNLAERLRAAGMTPQQALDLINTWNSDYDDAEDALQELITQACTQQIVEKGIKAACYTLATLTALEVVMYLHASYDASGREIAELLVYGVSGFLGMQATKAGFATWVLLQKLQQSDAWSREVLEAVREVAKPAVAAKQSDADKGAPVVDVERVKLALRACMAHIKVKYTLRRGVGSSLENLSAYVTLASAQQAGFQAAAYGITEQQAADLAAVFAKLDAKDTDHVDLATICSLAGQDLSAAELQEAAAMLGCAERPGGLRFSEFVAWWIHADRMEFTRGDSQTSVQ